MGIDPGREVDERFWRIGEQVPCRPEVAAVRQRLVRIVVGEDVRRTRPFGHDDRALRRLSASAVARGRPSGDLDRPPDYRARPLAQSRYAPSLPSPACGGGKGGGTTMRR